MKVSHWSSCVKRVLKNMKNVVGNFVTCTDGLYRPFKNWHLLMAQHENEAGTLSLLYLFCQGKNYGETYQYYIIQCF